MLAAEKETAAVSVAKATSRVCCSLSARCYNMARPFAFPISFAITHCRVPPLHAALLVHAVFVALSGC